MLIKSEKTIKLKDLIYPTHMDTYISGVSIATRYLEDNSTSSGIS